MTVNITKSSDPIKISTLVMILYGDPGIGKTSAGFTADKPLTLDFDGGVHRAKNRKDAVRITAWGDVENMTAEDLKPYNTVVVDTVGRCLDQLSAAIIADDPKMARRTGELTLQGYGALKGSFQQWIKRLKDYGKDVILLAHMKEDKKGDDMIWRPDVQGGSYNEIFKMADTVGFIHAEDGAEYGVIDWNPTSRWVGKNPATLDSPMTVPDFTENARFLSELIPDIKTALEQMSEESRKVFEEVQQYAQVIEGCNTATKLNDFIKAMKTEKCSDAAKAQVKALVAKQARKLKLTFDKEAGKFKKADSKKAASKKEKETADA